MPEIARTPQDVLETSIRGIEEADQTYREANEHVKALQNELRQAENDARSAKTKAWGLRSTALSEIHETATDEVDPGDYLSTVLSTRYGDKAVGEHVRTALAPLREDLKTGPTPVAVVGAKRAGIIFGKSAGDIVLKKIDLFDKSEYAEEVTFESASGLRLGIPLSERVSFGRSGTLDYVKGDDFFTIPDSEDTSPVWVKQSLGQLRVASTQADIDTFNEMPHAPFSQYDTVMHHESDVKNVLGFVPVVAHGEVAVTGLLKALYQSKNIANYKEKFDEDSVLAVAVTLGINPNQVAETSEDDVKERLAVRFASKLSSGIGRLITDEVWARKHVRFSTFGMWDVLVSDAVRQFVEVDEERLASIARTGLESAVSVIFGGPLRNDHPDDKASFYRSDTKKPEHRLLASEAQEMAVGFIVSKYSVTIEPAALESPIVAAKLADQLEKKREEKVMMEDIQKGRFHTLR